MRHGGAANAARVWRARDGALRFCVGPRPYRDPEAGLAARIDALDARVRELEARLGPRGRSALAPTERASLDHARHEARAPSHGTALASMGDRAARLERYVAALEASVGDEAAHAARLRALPTDVPLPPSPAHLARAVAAAREGLDAAWSALAARAHHLVATHDADVSSARTGPLELAVRFAFRGCPMALAGWPRRRAAFRGGTLDVEWTLATSVPACAPSLHVREEGLVDRVARLVGRALDVETGDPSFDGLFRVRAEPPDGARDLLPEPVRYRALELARAAVPELGVDPSTRSAWVRFACGLDDAVFLTAARLVVGLREAALRPPAVSAGAPSRP